MSTEKKIDKEKRPLSSQYEYFGAHFEGEGLSFRVLAPGAEAVFLVGDICTWESGLPMTRACDGVFEIKVSGIGANLTKYKYKIVSEQGICLKADPYAVCSEEFPKGASVIYDSRKHEWRDDSYLQHRKRYVGTLSSQPMNIYELDLAAWKRSDGGESLGYEELARELAPYVKQMGYTHIELVNFLEGTQAFGCRGVTSSFFSPRAELGYPIGLKKFIDGMHEAGVGVIVDVPFSLISRDEQGLYRFDGQPLYETEINRAWDRAQLDLSKPQTAQLISDCLAFWANEYHVDGITLVGVADALEADDFGRELASEFLRRLCADFKLGHADVLLICGESLGDERLSQMLGFDIERETTFGADVAAYSQIDPIFRKYDHEKITLSHVPLGDKTSILPLWHGELAHGRGALIERTFGDYWQKFAGVRALLGFMYTFPGKKLSFMGTEIGQFDEYDPTSHLQWSLLDYDAHARLQRYCAELGQFYLASPELWLLDAESDGFGWIDTSNRDQSIVSFYRSDDEGDPLVVLANFTPVAYENYRTGVPVRGEYREIFNSDDERYGGSGVINTGIIKSEPRQTNCLENSISIRIPPMAITVIRCVRRTQSKTRQNTVSTRKIIKK